MNHFKSNPVFGVGIGNWKLSSIFYDKEDITGYIVPYHAHSDFIQLGAELGIIGFILYFGIFLLAFYFVIVILFKSDLDSDKKLFVFFLLSSLAVYFIDANLNFPIARPQVLAPWALTMALIVYYYNQASPKVIIKRKKIISSNIFPLIGILFMIPSIFITNTTYQSLKGQLFLLRDFNTSKYSIPINKIDNITPDMPNITVTTIPMKTIKARYYINANKLDKALDLLNEGISANPYLFISENLKAQVFLKQGKIDSAYVNARKSFYGLPKNALHASTFAQVLQIKRDVEEAKKVFDVISKKSGPTIWKNFLIVLSQLLPTGDPDLVKHATRAVELFPDEKKFFPLKNLPLLDSKKLMKPIQFHKLDWIILIKNYMLKLQLNLKKLQKLIIWSMLILKMQQVLIIWQVISEKH